MSLKHVFVKRTVRLTLVIFASLLVLSACGDGVTAGDVPESSTPGTSLPEVSKDTPMPVEPDGGIGDGAGPILGLSEEGELVVGAWSDVCEPTLLANEPTDA